MQLGRVQGLAVKRVGGRAERRDVHRVEMGLQLLALEIVGCSVTANQEIDSGEDCAGEV